MLRQTCLNQACTPPTKPTCNMKIPSVLDFSLISATLTLFPLHPRTHSGERRAGGSEQPEGNFLTWYRLAAFVGPPPDERIVASGTWEPSRESAHVSDRGVAFRCARNGPAILTPDFRYVDGLIHSHGHTVCTQAEVEAENKQSRRWKKINLYASSTP